MQHITARATLKLRHDRARLDKATGLWTYDRGEEETYRNILTNAGRVVIHTFIYGTAADRAAASLGAGLHFIALSPDGTVPNPADTSLSGELVSDGLERVEGVVTLPTGSGIETTISNSFTYTGVAPQAVQKTALFDALSGGNMAHEILFTQKTLATNDVLNFTFTIQLT